MQTGEATAQQTAFNSEVEVNLDATDLDQLYNKMSGKILEILATHQMQGSNWVFKNIEELHMVRYEPLCRSSYI